MKRFIISLLLAVAALTAQAEYVTPLPGQGLLIGFRGLNGAFDQQAFEEFAHKRNLIPLAFDHDNVIVAVLIADLYIVDYELYGYSKGAESTLKFVKIAREANIMLPRHITTVGAYHTAKIDFRPYNISFKHYFDASGSRQRNPGVHLPKIRHDKIQAYINDCGC